jgi:hypothetical protein
MPMEPKTQRLTFAMTLRWNLRWQLPCSQADVQGTTQLNGVLAAAPLDGGVDERCGENQTRMLVGISGYP